MSDLATVKAEIKAWERDFKAKQGRSAQVQDIKEHPDIEAKYKLYKALGKASAAKGRATSYTPTTPSNSHKHEPSRLLPKARASETTEPLSTFNPFSPQKKNKGKQKEVLPAIKDFRSNPFATPSKVKSRAPAREVSPLPAAPFQPLVLPAASAIPEPTSAVTRARKRLRGEPVSPSPNKEKRRRVAPEHTLSFSEKEDFVPGDSDEDYAHIGNISFVDDSPVKGSNGFKLLFDDTTRSKSLFARTKTAPSSVDVFSSLDEEMDWQGSQSLKTNHHDSKANNRPFPRSAAPSNVHQKHREAVKKSTHAPVNITVSKPRKRVLSDADAAESSSHNRASSLIPPSPPLPDTSKRSYGSFKGKDKAASNNGRKKAKLAVTTSDSDDDDDEEPNKKIKVVPRTHGSPRKDMLGRNSDIDADDTFDVPSHTQIEDVGDGQDTGRFDVDLPDRFRHVLAFSPNETRTRDYQEVLVVEGLLYGRRVDHYDPSRGGEIWDVGEDEHGQVAVAEEEDDWQGEPVPWELGEL
ncbi:hypothetical protein F5146DRAFT_1021518 [Armillaria mellea]|nr:hypothetical protein F5146DRAFT_1021518 [Armillaria mellea]